MAERAAIVTGASSGIGLAIAQMLGEEGYGADDRRAAPGEARGRRRGAARPTGFDVQARRRRTSPTRRTIKEVVAAHRERYGRLDVLVNNAGVGIGAPVGEIETKQLDMQLDVNLRSIVLFYRECVDDAARRPAPSTATRWSSTRPRSPASAARRGCRSTRATKHGVVGWTEAMNKELGERGHQVDRAVPGVRRHADDRLRQGAGRRPRR